MAQSQANQAHPEKKVAPDKSKACVRDRIFATACDLFYHHGIRAVSVDMIASKAGSNKMSLYRSFPSKDALVAEYLQDQQRLLSERWGEIIAGCAGDPRAQVEALFKAHVARTCKGGSRGCALANAAVEIAEDDHTAREVLEQTKRDLRRRFRKLAAEMGAREPNVLGDSLMLLWEGVYVTRLTFKGRRGPANNALKAAKTLIDAHIG